MAVRFCTLGKKGNVKRMLSLRHRVQSEQTVRFVTSVTFPKDWITDNLLTESVGWFIKNCLMSLVNGFQYL
jgi:hypothetical protein